MKKFITFLSIISSLIFLSFFVKPQSVHADEKTYTIATDVTFPPLNMQMIVINMSALILT